MSIRYRTYRLICRLFSCDYDGQQACRRCGEWIYGGEFYDRGHITEAWIRFVTGPYWCFRDWTGRWKKCDHCGKRFWTHGDYCCSAKCYEDWCPF
jgi:hypothetical protein